VRRAASAIFERRAEALIESMQAGGLGGERPGEVLKFVIRPWSCDCAVTSVRVVAETKDLGLCSAIRLRG